MFRKVSLTQLLKGVTGSFGGSNEEAAAGDAEKVDITVKDVDQARKEKRSALTIATSRLEARARGRDVGKRARPTVDTSSSSSAPVRGARARSESSSMSSTESLGLLRSVNRAFACRVIPHKLVPPQTLSWCVCFVYHQHKATHRTTKFPARVDFPLLPAPHTNRSPKRNLSLDSDSDEVVERSAKRPASGRYNVKHRSAPSTSSIAEEAYAMTLPAPVSDLWVGKAVRSMTMPSLDDKEGARGSFRMGSSRPNSLRLSSRRKKASGRSSRRPTSGRHRALGAAEIKLCKCTKCGTKLKVPAGHSIFSCPCGQRMRVQEQPKSPELAAEISLGGVIPEDLGDKSRPITGGRGAGSTRGRLGEQQMGVGGPSVTLVACSVCQKELHAPTNCPIFTCPGCETVLTHSGQSFEAAVEHMKRLQTQKERDADKYAQVQSNFSLRPASFRGAKIGLGFAGFRAGSGRSSSMTDVSMEDEDERAV